MKIVLYQPQIPQNTGTIARTCAASGTDLILVRPLGFSTNSRHLKRAGLDYWDGVCVQEVDDLNPLLKEAPFFFFSSKAKTRYTDVQIPSNALLIFGSETSGLPQEYFEQWPNQFLTIPMMEGSRCLNLACSASIVLYEALRQHHFLFPKKTERNMESKMLATNEVASGR